jgi:hypothetical protein
MRVFSAARRNASSYFAIGFAGAAFFFAFAFLAIFISGSTDSPLRAVRHLIRKLSGKVHGESNILAH